jgi:putative membrane protein
LAVHMAQHMLLTMVAAPLIVIGSPIALALRLLPRAEARRLVAGMRRSRLLRLVAAPALGWGLLSAVQMAVYFTPLLELADRSAWVHAGVHAALFGSALLFWRPVLGADPLHRPAPVVQIAYLLSAMPFNDLVGVWLVASSHVQYPADAVQGLSDQRQAGVVMLAGSFILGAAALAAAWSWIRLDDRRALLREQTG